MTTTIIVLVAIVLGFLWLYRVAKNIPVIDEDNPDVDYYLLIDDKYDAMINSRNGRELKRKKMEEEYAEKKNASK